ncbi:uncharacterized protein LOC125768818 isoform X3 [Anopheles funestus]|uniref:uncharacterized protein LOC125768818 isoform X3 n=1 Tax=Anopheles funestus TaxID=62324 RepID=UPI0020C63A8D|nr:uncharacterized protein LOC125768818 isoform X3 [Anopheles funestus]
MEHSLNQRDGINPSPTSIGATSTIKQEPFDEEMQELKIEILHDASSWECSIKADPLKEEIEIDETDLTVQDPFFMIEEIGINAESNAAQNEEIEDHVVVSSIPGDAGMKHDTGFPDNEDVSSHVSGPNTSKRRCKATSDEDRKRVVAAYEKGCTVRMIAEMLSLKRPTVHSILKSYWKTGEYEARKRGGIKTKKLTSAILVDMQSWMDEDCSISLSKLSQKIYECHAIRVSKPTIARAIKNFNYSFKRVKILPERRNNSSTVEERKEYALSYNRITQRFPQAAIVFIGEVAFNITMRTVKGRPLIGSIDEKVVLRTRNISIVCAMNRAGILHYITINRVINQELLVGFIKQLKEHLKEQDVGNQTLIIVNNVAFHKCTTILETFSAEGCKVKYLPPNSPFLNPVEMFFNDLKNLIKRTNPQHEQEIMSAIEKGASLTTVKDCEGYFGEMWQYIERCRLGEEITD